MTITKSERDQLIARRQAVAREIVAQLRATGVEVDSLSPFPEMELPTQAVDLLLGQLKVQDDTTIKSAIARALASGSPQGKRVAQQLIAELRECSDPTRSSYGWALGDALCQLADASVLDDLVELAQKQELGQARETVVMALERFGDKTRVRNLLRQLLKDDVVAGHALTTLKKIGAREARDDIEPLLEHPKAWVRREAKKTLAKFDRAEPQKRKKPTVSRSREASPPPADGSLTEASSNFDFDEVPELLRRIGTIVEGLSEGAIDEIEQRLLEMEVEDEERFSLKVRFANGQVPLLMTVRMSDVDAPDVAFHTSQQLAERIRELIKAL